jgi:hypothetical protein
VDIINAPGITLMSKDSKKVRELLKDRRNIKL